MACKECVPYRSASLAARVHHGHFLCEPRLYLKYGHQLALATALMTQHAQANLPCLGGLQHYTGMNHALNRSRTSPHPRYLLQLSHKNTCNSCSRGHGRLLGQGCGGSLARKLIGRLHLPLTMQICSKCYRKQLVHEKKTLPIFQRVIVRR